MARPAYAPGPALVFVLVSGLVLGGCGGDDTPGPAAAVSPTEAAWNPCDGLSAERIGKALGAQVHMETGPAEAPHCTFVPVVEGDAVIEANYQLFSGGLAAAWATQPQGPGVVTQPAIRGADDARLIVSVTRKAAAVTGFVENGDLIQVVNLVDLRPYDKVAAIRTARLVMADLSAHADAAGVE